MRNMKTATIIDPEIGKRCDKTEYPVSAIREAVLNALIHRDYSIYTEGTPIQIDFFSDRLEIHSPGSLYGRISVEDLGFAHPDARNPVLAVMTESLTDAEHRYSGIPTMRRAMQEAGLPAPYSSTDRMSLSLYCTTILLNQRIRLSQPIQQTKQPHFCNLPHTAHPQRDCRFSSVSELQTTPTSAIFSRWLSKAS